MLRKLIGIAVCAATIASAQMPRYNRKNVAGILGFETQKNGNLPKGWSGWPSATVVTESDVVHSGRWAVRLDRTSQSAGGFSTLSTAIPMDFGGKSIELRGWLRTENVSGFAGLWLREDEHGSSLQFDNMQEQNLHGTHDWQAFSVKLPLVEDADRVVFGALLIGSGVAWVDDLELLVDGKPVAEAPPPTPLVPSGIRISNLTPLQIDNLALLGRVWGFLKYHDPVVTAGQRNWDEALFHVMPQVLAARSVAEANDAMMRWTKSLGPIKACTQCAKLSTTGLMERPNIEWIHDTKLLGVPLSRRLVSIYANRAPNQQYYVSLVPQVGNPVFQHEETYGGQRFPDAGYQLLGLFRLWNIVEYWAPNRQLVGENWPDVLRAFIPQTARATDRNAYALIMMRFIAKIHDTHANLWGSLALRPPVGTCRLPVNVQFVRSEAVVSGYSSDKTGPVSGLKRGDMIAAIGGIPMRQLVREWTPYYADSNQAAMRRDIAHALTGGACGPVPLVVHRNGKRTALTAVRLDAAEAGPAWPHEDLPGPTFRLLSPEIAYLKLSSVKAADVPRSIAQAKGTRGLILDLRNYPSEFVVFSLGSLLVQKPTPFAEFSVADLSNPGAFRVGPIVSLTPAQPHYDGKVVVLVDAETQSQAEYTTMALQAAPNTVVVGSRTAGADGDVSAIPLPGGLSTLISGLGVYYPNGAPTQRVGVRVNVTVPPMIAGIRAGRDEVLEAAIRQIDPSLSAEAVKRIAEPATKTAPGN